MSEMDVMKPPTEIEIAEIMDVLRKNGSPAISWLWTVRRLAYQRDKALTEVSRLSAELSRLKANRQGVESIA